jgi:hypothetical protein
LRSLHNPHQEGLDRDPAVGEGREADGLVDDVHLVLPQGDPALDGARQAGELHLLWDAFLVLELATAWTDLPSDLEVGGVYRPLGMATKRSTRP